MGAMRCGAVSPVYVYVYSGRFATELAGRKARRKGWAGLAEEMAGAGWFEL